MNVLKEGELNQFSSYEYLKLQKIKPCHSYNFSLEMSNIKNYYQNLSYLERFSYIDITLFSYVDKITTI